MNDLLIGTARQLVFWNGKQNTLAKGNYYGITWDKDCLYCRRNLEHIPISIIEKFDKDTLKLCGKLPVSYLSGIHQILAINEEIHITHTSKNRIDVYDGSETIRSYNWTNNEKDSHHFNSIWFKDNKIYIVESGLAGEKSPPSIQVLNKKYRCLEKIDLPGAIHIHNIYIEEGSLYSCGKFGLVQKDLKRNRYSTIDLRRDKRNGFFRGFARSNTYFYVGESQILPRKERSYGDATIVVMDNNLKIVEIIELKETGQIQEIRIVNDIDFAHVDNALECKYE